MPLPVRDTLNVSPEPDDCAGEQAEEDEREHSIPAALLPLDRSEQQEQRPCEHECCEGEG
jgi:hypothetical protein